jgi:uncharacterized membrane protein YhaH (DUF805 family)
MSETKNTSKNDLSNALKTFWTDYVGWGRATRAEFWWAYLFYIVIGGIVLTPFVGVLWSLATLVPSFCITARRLHDTNRSNWNVCWALLPVIGWVILIVYLCQPSDTKANRFGQPRI